jgi:hypothetical protein
MQPPEAPLRVAGSERERVNCERQRSDADRRDSCLKGHFLFRWTTNDLPFPIQHKRLLRKMLPLADRPGFAVDLQFITPLMNEMAT